MSLKEFFYFQKSDRKVIVVALCVIVAALLAIFFLGRNTTTGLSDNSGYPDSTDYSLRPESSGPSDGQPTNFSPERFVFDPNTADSSQLIRLGLQPWQVRNILKYRAKGGVYREPSDFARVYGLTVKQYRELQPYIRISPDYRPASEVYGRNRSYHAPRNGYGSSSHGSYDRGSEKEVGGDAATPTFYARDTVRYPVKLKVGEHVGLNVADTTMLKKVPGIGSYYARRIVAYRDRLGGFADVRQLLEIEGFPEEALAFFDVGNGPFRRLNLNKLSLSQLRSHPYLNFYQAKAITEYRRLKGPIHSLSDLSLSPEFPPQEIERLVPYVEF
ncbi:MAG: helix-hairpin-helix domain-containing protein [Prevotella sp.]|nr:helix-hairpin-helix domain-containing protein [Prevotella sp.]